MRADGTELEAIEGENAPPIFHLHICLDSQAGPRSLQGKQFHVFFLHAKQALPSDEDIVCLALSISSSVAFAHVWHGRKEGREDSSSNCALTAHYEALKVGAEAAGQTAFGVPMPCRFERFNFAVISARDLAWPAKEAREEPRAELPAAAAAAATAAAAAWPFT